VVQITYNMTPTEVEDDCLPDLCTTCDYLIEFFAYNNECPASLLPITGYNSPISVPATLSDLAALNCGQANTFPQQTLSVALPGAGSYTIGRRITLNNPVGQSPGIPASDYHYQQAWAAYDDALNTAFGPMLTTLQGFTDPLTQLPTFYAAQGVGANDTEFHVSVPGGTDDPPCYTATLPVLVCPPCAVTGSSMLDYLDELTTADINTFLDYPECGAPGDHLFTENILNNLITHMLAAVDGNGNHYYTCDQLWGCWQNSAQPT
jgi:hypothetical protein